MNESTLWFVLAICGLATLLIGLAIFLFIAVTRMSGRGMLGFMNFLVGRANDKTRDQVSEDVMAHAPHPDLNQIAQAKSFDDALRAQGAPVPGQTFTAHTAPSATRFNPGFPAPGTAPVVPTSPGASPLTPRLDSLPPTDAPDLRPRRDNRADDDAFGVYEGEG